MFAAQFDDRFVRSLPGEASGEARPRLVRNVCYSRVHPTPVSAPRLLALIPEVAELLDLPLEETPELVDVLAGNRVLPGMAPYAACYGGHQFGNWAGQLGDGRAITLGELVNRRGERWEIQLKGAGLTPYSRGADGRAVLRSSLRELVASEAMFHLGVPTTRALSLVTTGEAVRRDLLYDGNPADEPGAIVCRVAPSFLRFGNYQIHASRGEAEILRQLVEFTIQHHFPELGPYSPETVTRFFEEVSRRTARLMIEWMRVGFVHGVMNTDNMSILGLTIDYGPFGWLEPFDPSWTPNITDAAGRRYRYAQQPRVAQWNLAQLASALLPLVGAPEPLEAALDDYAELYEFGQRAMMLDKLGLRERAERWDGDGALVLDLFEVLTRVETDMTLFFRRLADLPIDPATPPLRTLRDAYYAPDALTDADQQALEAWVERYRARVREDGEPDAVRRARMNKTNPLYVPRNYLLQIAIERAEEGDPGALAELLDVLRRPYDEQPGREAYAEKRPEWARHRPGCSMLSCSS